MINIRFSLLLLLFILHSICDAQVVPILDSSVNVFGQVEHQIVGSSDQYYLLSASHEPNSTYESVTSMTLGVDGPMLITEPLASLPYDSYTITAHPIASPVDTDGDGFDDVTESQFLNDQEFVKFAILNQHTDSPRVFFINSKTHYIHADFLATIDTAGDLLTTGEVVYNPNVLSINGTLGTYSFNYSFGDALTFESTQRTFELLAASMPFLQNNFQHFIGDVGENQYTTNHQDDYVGSRIHVVLESTFFEDVDFIPFNQSEGFGFFRVMGLDDNPGSRDIVLYDALPNSLPRVGGIITSVVQTPLSHVNLRAIQDNLPNAYIKNPLEIPEISELVGKFVYYQVTDEDYTLREATLEEVNDWYENIRPTEAQIPVRDLSKTEILPLSEIGFEMSSAFGAKCSNVATMRTFGFPEGTIPNGYGIPFYYYDEFMKYNGFYAEVEAMITDPLFISDLETRIDMLKDLRSEIKDADMPQWMLDNLQEMHDAFPEGTAVRVRSSTNNEDLPGFSGAGLYTSKTQHLDEGHISKSVKQVYASMWNFRAFDERDFYRVDHHIAAMGLLCHPNYNEEKSNGVGVSIDPLYETDSTFYLNTQIDEFLITNPDANSIAEEILLSQDPVDGYTVLRYSNLVPNGVLIMDEDYLDTLRSQLQVIHDEFAVLYNVVGAEGFGMDIEYKVTAQDKLIIKQARPWVSFWADIKSTFDLSVNTILEPQSSSSLSDSELITANIANSGLREMKDFQLSLIVNDEVVEILDVADEIAPFTDQNYQFTLPQDFSMKGDYSVGVAVEHLLDGFSRNDTLTDIITNLYQLEGALESELSSIFCGSELLAKATVTNTGEMPITFVGIEVFANGVLVENFVEFVDINYQESKDVFIPINQNLVNGGNDITLNLYNVNGQADSVSSNNESSFNADLESSDIKKFTLVINTDMYPEETSWELIDVNSGLQVASGGDYEASLQTTYEEELCVVSGGCYKLFFYDEYSDGICCGFGEGNFSIVSDTGEEIVYNDGNFGGTAEEDFCVEGISNTSDEIVSANIRAYPNPTQGQVTIELGENTLTASEDIDVVLFNSLGSEVKRSTIHSSLGETQIVLSLVELTPGTYIAKCYKQSLDKESYKS